MKLDFIPLGKLSVSKTNMRYAKKAPDVSDILPTIRKRGILQPLIVRKNCGPDAYEILGGARRFHAAQIVHAERLAANEPTGDAVPCAIIEESDDAAAVEASLIENLARLDPDEVTQWETFTRLVKEGRSPDDIAATFGLPDLAVRRILALGNLLPRIRDMYRAETIDAGTVRHLTLASKSQQKAWLALADDPETYLPTGHQLKAWLFGGQSIAVKQALFDVEASGLATVADLFGEDRYFADADAFWTAQNAGIEAQRAAMIEAGWSDAVIIPPSQHFSTWEYEKAGKRKGGRVYIDVRSSGEVSIHEGYLTAKEARRLASGEASETATKPVRPEISGPMATYIDLHRHAATRAVLCNHPSIALRMMVAHSIVGSPYWAVRPDPQSARNDVTRESIETCRAEAAFDERRRAVLAVLGFDADAPTVTGGNADDYGIAGLFARLLDLPDPVVMDVIAIVMGETLASGSAAVEVLGSQIGVDMASWWEADDAFFALLRDREVLTRIVADVAGEGVASANANEKAKTMKGIIADHLGGANGRAKVNGWVPRWMAFPPAAYTQRGGVGTVRAAALAAAARDGNEQPDDEPNPPAAAGGRKDAGDDGGTDAVIDDTEHEKRLAA